MKWGALSRYRSQLMGVFCLWIMVHHSNTVCTWPRVLEPLRMFGVRGHIGVDAFLILSGVGLYYAYSKLTATVPNAGRRLGQFYYRRFVRLFIPYLLLAAPYFAWVAWILKREGVSRFLLDFFQLSLPLRGEHALWYIAALTLFYLLYPLIFRLQEKPASVLGKAGSRASVTVLMCFAAVLMCWLTARFFPKFYGNCEIMLARLPVFILGCALGKWVKEDKPVPSGAVLGAAAFMFIYVYVFAGAAKSMPLWMRLSDSAFALAAVLVFAWAFCKLDACRGLQKIFSFCGERSLELYLTHVMARRIWLAYLPKNLWDKWGALSYLCILLAAFIVSVIVHPLIKWLSKKLLSVGGAAKATA